LGARNGLRRLGEAALNGLADDLLSMLFGKSTVKFSFAGRSTRATGSRLARRETA